MKTGHFLIICGLISLGLAYLIQDLQAYLEFELPYRHSVMMKVVQALIILPVVYIILNPVNKKIRLWRKARGRDIEAEEKSETASTFIKLTRRD